MIQIILFVYLSIFSNAIRAQPFALIIDTPKNIGDDVEMLLSDQILESVTVPDAGDIVISYYPIAGVFQTTIGQVGILFTVHILSKDEVKAVIDYYKKDGNNIFTFFMGKEMRAWMGRIHFIYIVSANIFSKTMPNTQSVI